MGRRTDPTSQRTGPHHAVYRARRADSLETGQSGRPLALGVAQPSMTTFICHCGCRHHAAARFSGHTTIAICNSSKKFVRAALRERRRDPDHGWTNASLASRLPAWIKEAKNRDQC